MSTTSSLDTLQRDNASLVQLVRTLEEYSRELEAKLAAAGQPIDIPKPDSTTASASTAGPSSLVRQLNEERKRVVELEAQVQQERKEKEALAKESLSQLSRSLGAMQSQASAALSQSHELTDSLQKELEVTKAALVEKDVQLARMKETLLTELVRLRRLYESREAQFTAESDHCQGQLEQLLKLNSAKDAVYAHEKDALITELQLINQNRSNRESVLMQELAVLRANVEELSVELVRAQAAAKRVTTDESVLVEELRAQLGEVKRLRDEAAMRHAAELKDALTSMQHQDSVEVMSLTARLQKEQDKNAALLESVELLQRRCGELSESSQEGNQRVGDLASTLSGIRDEYEAELTRCRAESKKQYELLRGEVSSLQQDVTDVSSALADTASALRLSEKQLQTALESKASDVAELEALISRMQAAHKAENDQSAALLAAQAKELEVALSIAKSREQALLEASTAFVALERELRAALANTTDALYACELQKAGVEATCLDSIGRMQQQLDHETALHQQAEIASAAVISQLQTKVLNLSRELQQQSRDHATAVETSEAFWGEKVSRLRSEVAAHQSAQKLLEVNLRELRESFQAERQRLEAEVATLAAQRDQYAEQYSVAQEQHESEIQGLKADIAQLQAKALESRTAADYQDANSTLSYQSDVRRFLHVLSERAEDVEFVDADQAVSVDVPATAVRVPVSVGGGLTPVLESPSDEDSPPPPKRLSGDRVSKSVRIVQDLIATVHDATARNVMAVEEFKRAASDELTVFRNAASRNADSCDAVNSMWAKEKACMEAAIQANNDKLSTAQASAVEASAMLQSLVTSLSDITRRWAADQGDRDSVHDKYVEGIGAMAQDLENRAARTRTALTDVARLAEADRASSQRLNDVVIQLSETVVKLVNDSAVASLSGVNFLSELRGMMTRHAAAVSETALKHENVLLEEIAKMKSQLISQQQSKIDAELALLNEKRELLKELHDMKGRVEDENAAVTEAIKSSRQRWELIANEREATFMRELAVSRAQTLKLQEIEKDMEFVCRSERELSNRAYVSLKKSVSAERAFVAEEVNTFATFLETVQSYSSLLFRTQMDEMSNLQRDIEALRQLLSDKEAVYQSKLKTIEASHREAASPAATPQLRRQGSELTLSQEKIKLHDDANIRLLTQELKRLSAELDELRSRVVEKDAESVAHIQTLTSGLRALSETFGAFMQRVREEGETQQRDNVSTVSFDADDEPPKPLRLEDTDAASVGGK